MVTPVETAGLILAALPLVIAAFEHYRKGLDPLKDYWRYNSLLKALQTRLRLEQVLYQGTLERLLINELSQPQLEALFPNPGEPLETSLWGTRGVEKRLQAKLGRKYDIFIDVIMVMDATLKKLMEKLDIDLEGKPKWASASGSDGRLMWEWRRVRRSFGKREREELIQEFEKYNAKIAAWVQNNEILAPQSEGRPEPFTEYFGLVRDHACRLHSILEHSWSSSCINNPHNANLQLDQRNKIEQSPSFHVRFSLHRNASSQKGQVMWRGTQIHLSEVELRGSQGGAPNASVATSLCREAISTTLNGDQLRALPIAPAHPNSRPESGRAVCSPFQLERPPLAAAPGHATQTGAEAGRSNESLTRIACLCKAIHDTQNSPNFLEVLHEPSRGHSASITATDTTPMTLLTPLRLSELLQSKQKNSSRASGFGELSKRQRLGLAVTLASTVLQLYKSPWLGDVWGKNDIYFFFNGLDDDGCPNISDPHVLQSFGSPPVKRIPEKPTNAATNSPLNYLIINKTLFALGVILIELCLNRPFEDLRRATDPQSQPNIIDDYHTANSVMNDVYKEGGDRYGYVVQRCLKCEFGVQDSKKRLDSDAFRCLVYKGVLLPLEEDYEKFSLYLGVTT